MLILSGHMICVVCFFCDASTHTHSSLSLGEGSRIRRLQHKIVRRPNDVNGESGACVLLLEDGEVFDFEFG